MPTTAVVSSGTAWGQLEDKVDGFVEAFMDEKPLPGMTVAVTKAGRLILSKGYGFARVDGTRKLPMKPCMRSSIGSVTKAVVTGPAGIQLMKSKHLNPTTTTLYGPKGLFGEKFDADIDIGIQNGIKANKPDVAKWKRWYEKITVQNLLDHKAGFIGSGDVKGAAKMFDVSEAELTYEQAHRHFLRTRPIYEPGTTPSKELLEQLGTDRTYSNHGFGLWTLLIPQMSGKSYYDYVRDEYLKPLKLHHAIRPERTIPDSCDANEHLIRDGKLDVFPFEGNRLGLAAGGFMSSAESLVRVTVTLDTKHTVAELDSMGWGKDAKGKLAHGGDGSGIAYVAMFPNGYVSNSGTDLSEVHVAIAANIRIGNGLGSGDLKNLSDQIVKAVPASNVPVTFNLWHQSKSGCSCEDTRHGVPANAYQQVFDEAVQAGYRLEWIDGYTENGKVHFNVIFRTNENGIRWASHHNMASATYQEHFDEYGAKGFSLDHVDSYVVGNDVRYAAIWTKSGEAVTAYHGKTAAAHQESFDTLTSAGWRPKVISVASVGTALHYTALYTRQSIGQFEARSSLTPEEYQTKFDQNTANGRHLHYLNSFLHKGHLHFSAIWAQKPGVSRFQAKHGLTAKQCRTIWEDEMSAGSATRAITGYEVNGKVRFAAYWAK